MALDLKTPVTPPPAKRSPGRPRVSATAAGKQAERADGLNSLFQVSAAVLVMFGQVADAGAIADHGENISKEAAVLAESNANVAKALDYLTQVGPFAGLFAAVMPLALQILVNHGKAPAAPLAKFGVVEPGMLEARIQAEAMRQQAEMMREQARAQEEMRQLQAELQAQEPGAA